jgi:NADH-ubiquinone oxidoreductase chain 5
MEGPTPVSALIHAATLVTAGVFLIIRCSPIFEFAEITLIIIMFMGGITAFFSATIAITQDDIKKVIAYSTCSQLGYMIYICGLSEYNLSLFHLINHAFFKALLFLSAGAVIHALSGEQDMRQFGSLSKMIPFTYSMMLLGFLALSGFPFLSGFYSKDLILEASFSKYAINSIFVYWLGSISALLTAFYSFRVLCYSF